MKNNFLIFIAVTSLFFSYNSFAQEAEQGENNSEAMHFKDPFKSQLPKREVVLPVKKEMPTDSTVKIAPEEVISPPTFHITGIVWGTTRPQAIINDQVVDVGNTIEGATITGINKFGVEVSYRGQHFTIDPNKQVNDQKMAQANTYSAVNQQPRYAR